MSVPDLTGDVKRATRVTVRGQLPGTGEETDVVTDAFEARALQHEIDHCAGLLFLDRVAGAHALHARQVYLDAPADPGVLTSGGTPLSHGGPCGRTRLPHTGGVRTRRLGSVLARHAARVRSRRTLLASTGRALAVTLVAAVLALPLAAAWGVGHAAGRRLPRPQPGLARRRLQRRDRDRPRPARPRLPPQPVRPGRPPGRPSAGWGSPARRSARSSRTRRSTCTPPSTPTPRRRSAASSSGSSATRSSGRPVAEAVLLVGFAVWSLRSRLLAPWVVRRVTRRRTLAVYGVVMAVVVGGVLVPSRPDGPRIPVDLPLPDASADDQRRQPAARRPARPRRSPASGSSAPASRRRSRRGSETATQSLSAQLAALPRPAAGRADGVRLQRPALQPGDDRADDAGSSPSPTRPSSSTRATTPSTAPPPSAAASGARWAIPGGRPFVVATGNHDSDVTEAQLRAAGATVLDGATVEVGGRDVLGDDDPERQVPFSVERTLDRPEDEAQLGQRMVQAARPRPVDAILVHQPTAAAAAHGRARPARAARAVGPHARARWARPSSPHADGSWTVGMQQGTSGGVKQPTLASFSTPFSPPLVRADSYFYFSDVATGLVTGVQAGAPRARRRGRLRPPAPTPGTSPPCPPRRGAAWPGRAASPTPRGPPLTVPCAERHHARLTLATAARPS